MNQGAQGDSDDKGRTVFAYAVLALPGTAIFGLEQAAPPEVSQGTFMTRSF
jgi:hypothetical protein